ncbi:hypothetical protein M2171_005657 [Bradyrhizobium japonicum USDA 38]|uniref:hypothetical protein n=1 Tax=Bradyrhizobium japonicum TaxID=375 RepID=UPI0003F5C098|nr:hypothetical protein [Bradyrhizobium japonicum]MCS3896524.1 hypothetical protein [Bradyrhizobium japonicum USDA 38]MCS3949039.1 hypothetical protein [Bradyrhizobium japonicum]MCW2218276.1 hypothetical protein [Bradyrhizobium japonicum]MCW2342890.1 hypothetical protein [Bradyrhizobium japonicum]
MPPWVGLAILFAIGGFAFVLPAWTDAIVRLGRLCGITESWAGFAGNLIGSVLTSAIAAAAIYFAYVGIREQIRAGVLAREEDRLLRELPGLRDALDLLHRIVAKLNESNVGPTGAIFEFREIGLGQIESTLSKEIKTLLPDTDDTTLVQIRRAVADAIKTSSEAASEAGYAQSLIDTAYNPEMEIWGTPAFKDYERQIELQTRIVAEHKVGFANAFKAIVGLAQEIEDRINLYETRLPRIRRVMSEYFDR